MTMIQFSFYDIRPCDNIRWIMEDGNSNRGIVVDAVMEANHTGSFIPWYIVQDLDGMKHAICGLTTNIRQISLEIISRKDKNQDTTKIEKDFF